MDPARPKVLVVQHEDLVPPRLLEGWLAEESCELTVLRPDRGDPLPSGEGLGSCGAVVVLGGTMDSWDDTGHPWFPAVRGLVLDAARTRTPLLGICLGQQLAVQAFGGEVARNPAGKSAGVLPVGWADRARTDPLLGPVADATGSDAVAVHHNSDVASRLPAGCDVLASAPDGSAQVVRFAETVWGVQCHPEADADLVRGWEQRGGQSADESVVGQVAAAADRLRATWRPLAASLARLAREGVPA